MESIHQKCLGLKHDQGVVLICGKSRGHVSPQCYDPDEDRYYIAEYKPKPKGK